MKQLVVILTVVTILLPAAQQTVAAPGVGDQLSLSITNKYGDVLVNPTVGQILGDGLILQSGASMMKIKYDDLPLGIRQKYQPLAAGVITNEEKQIAANAAYFARTERLQAEDSLHRAVREAQENELANARSGNQPAAAQKYLAIPIPGQSWKVTIADLGFGNWQRQQDSNQFLLHGQTGPGGFSLTLFVENPANNIPGNDPAYNFFWLNMAHNSLIDSQSVKVERRAAFIKVSYTAQGQANVNYFFAYQGKWVDLHLAKGLSEAGDDKRFAEFDAGLSYGQ